VDDHRQAGALDLSVGQLAQLPVLPARA